MNETGRPGSENLTRRDHEACVEAVFKSLCKTAKASGPHQYNTILKTVNFFFKSVGW